MAGTDVTRFIVRGHRDRTCNVAVTGPLDSYAASSLRCLLLELERDRVTLDLTECSVVTDEALDALTAAARVADAHGGSVRVHSNRGARIAELLLDEPPLGEDTLILATRSPSRHTHDSAERADEPTAAGMYGGTPAGTV